MRHIILDTKQHRALLNLLGGICTDPVLADVYDAVHNAPKAKPSVKAKPLTVEVCERMHDRGLCPVIVDDKIVDSKSMPKYHAKIKGLAGFGQGTSVQSALGDLIMSQPTTFSIKITDLGKQPR